MRNMLHGSLANELSARQMLRWQDFARNFWDWAVGCPAALHILNASSAATNKDIKVLNVPGAWIADLLFTLLRQLLYDPKPVGDSQMYAVVPNHQWERMAQRLDVLRPAQWTDPHHSPDLARRS